MRKLNMLLAAVACVLAGGWMISRAAESAAPATTAAPAAEWLTAPDKATAAAQATGKPILVDFTGSDWCGWCIRLKAEVFDTPEFKAWAAQNVVLLELDFPQNRPQDAETKARNTALAKKHRVRGYPTILFLNADGTEIGRSGYLPGGPKNWLANAGQIIKGAHSQPASAPKPAPGTRPATAPRPR